MSNRYLALAVALLSLGLPASAAAQTQGPGGRQIRLDDAPAGPYRVRALTSPIPPRVGDLLVEIRVADLSGDILQDVNVELSAVPLEGQSEPISAIAKSDLAPTPGEYAAFLDVREVGFWNIVVRIEGPLGTGQAEFVERVVPMNHWVHTLVIAAPFAGLLALLWIFRRPRRESPVLGSHGGVPISG